MGIPLSSGDRADKYIISDLVGEGGFGRVYRAEHRTLGRVVALKELVEDRIAPADLPTAIEDFEREARLLCRLTESKEIRKFIPQVYDYFEHDGRRFLAMQFVEGQTLEDKLAEARGPLPWQQVLEWAIQVCTALECFHSQTPPVVFRDIKPSNLMICSQDGQIRIIDFGIAKQLRADMSMSTRWLGSPGYAAPEQMIGHPSPESDIYSLGATIYRLITGRQPRADSGSPYDLLSASEATKSLGSDAVPESASDIIGKCMKLDLAQRYRTASDLRIALNRELGRTGDFSSKPHSAPINKEKSEKKTVPIRKEMIESSNPIVFENKAVPSKQGETRKIPRFVILGAFPTLLVLSVCVWFFINHGYVKSQSPSPPTAVLSHPPTAFDPLDAANKLSKQVVKPMTAKPKALVLRKISRFLYCWQCGKKAARGDVFCGNCGNDLKKPVKVVFCPECGVKAAVNDTVCTKCKVDLRRL